MESSGVDGRARSLTAAPQSRRTALRRGVGLMASLAAVGRWQSEALSQAATPAGGESLRSLTREAYQAQLVADLGYTEAVTPGGTFLDSSTADVTTLQPAFATDAVSLSIVSLIYDGLVRGDVRTGQPAPTSLADWWEIAPDGRIYTFYLNQDAKWHDGVNVTAEDVQFTFDALANATDPASIFTASTESWRAIDAITFEMVAFEPYYTFLYDLPGFILPRHLWESVPFADWQGDPGATGTDPSRVVGSGPFTFHERRPGESITLVRPHCRCCPGTGRRRHRSSGSADRPGMSWRHGRRSGSCPARPSWGTSPDRCRSSTPHPYRGTPSRRRRSRTHCGPEACGGSWQSPRQVGVLPTRRRPRQGPVAQGDETNPRSGTG